MVEALPAAGPGIVAYEWWRIQSLRSTWVLLTSIAATSTVVAWCVALATKEGVLSEHQAVISTAVSQGGSFDVPFFAAHLCGFFGALAWGEEVRGGSVTTLTTMTGRYRVFVGRTAATVVYAGVAALLGIAVVMTVVSVDLGANLFVSEPRQLLVQGLRATAYFEFLTLVYAGATLVLRSPATAVFAVLSAQFLVEPLIRGIVLLIPSFQDFAEVLKYLPFAAADSMLVSPTQDTGFTIVQGLGLLPAAVECAALAMALTTAAALLFRVRDP